MILHASPPSKPDVSQRDQAPLNYPLIELMFFAYRDFIAEADAVLEEFGFGRAHHRALHFVDRHPGMRVFELLDTLKITKQSLGRVLKALVEAGLIEHRQGKDRRQKLLFTTVSGHALAHRLATLQSRRLETALDHLVSTTPDFVDPLTLQAAHGLIAAFLYGLIQTSDRASVSALITTEAHTSCQRP